MFQAPRTVAAAGGAVLTVDMLEIDSASGLPLQLYLFLVIFQGDSQSDRRSQVIWVQASAPVPPETCAPGPGGASSELSGLLDWESGPVEGCAVSASWQPAGRKTLPVTEVPLRAATLYGGGVRVDRCRLVKMPGGVLAGKEAHPPLSRVESTWLQAPHARKEGRGARDSAHCCLAWANAQHSGGALGLAASWGQSVVLYELFDGTWTVMNEVAPPEGLHRPVLRLAAWHGEGGSPEGGDPEGGFLATFASEMAIRESSSVFLKSSRDTSTSGVQNSETEGKEKALGEELLSDEGMTIIGQKRQVGAAAVPSMFILGEMVQGEEARRVHATCSLLYRSGRSSSAMADLALDLDFLPYPDIAVSRGGFLYLSSTLGPPQVALVALCQPGRSAACSRPLENAGKPMQGRSLQVLKKFSLGNILCSTGLSEPAPEVRVRALEILESGHEPLPVENAAEAGANFVVQLEKKEPPASGRFFSGQVAGSSVSEVYCASYEFRAPSRGREIPGRDSQLHALERRFAARMDALERTLCGALSDLSASVCTRLDALEAKVATVAQAHPRS